MDKKIQILDCTLRDGCYINNGKFGDSTINGLISRLEKSHIDIIECGWLKDSIREKGSAYFHQPSDAESFILDDNRKSKYVAMIDWNRYNVQSLENYTGKGIEAIRIVFPRDHMEEGLALVPIIKSKGYKAMIQAANTLGYSDSDLIKLSEKVNKVMPDSISIVDTFGAMYKDDLYRIMSILDNNIDSSIKIGFHSHNNQQMSFSLAQNFIEFASKTNREIIVDSSLCGMGRGAGNANTELIVSYLNKFFHKDYDLDLILDTIDIYMSNILSNYKWGYSVPLFIAGMNCTHVNNIKYLQDTHHAGARDIFNTLGALSKDERTLYDYDKLENAYISYINADIDDSDAFKLLDNLISNRTILLIAPGKKSVTEQKTIDNYIRDVKPFVIGINWVPDLYKCDFIFFSNVKRFEYSRDCFSSDFDNLRKVITSNIKKQKDNNTIIINYNKLLKREWKYYDNSLFLCLQLLNKLEITDIAIAGFDGLRSGENYGDYNLESTYEEKERICFNENLVGMMNDFLSLNKDKINIRFLTQSIMDKS